MNVIHPTAIIDSTVEMGSGNYIGPYCVIGPFVKMGNGNRFESHCVIGAPAEHRDFMKTPNYGKVLISNHNVFRSYVTVDSSTDEYTATFIGDGNTLLRGSHVGHDCNLHNNITLSCNALIGGHTTIMNGVNVGLGAVIHQRQVLGSYAMIGMGSVVTKKSEIAPGWIYAGNPVTVLRKNDIGLERSCVGPRILEDLTKDWASRLKFERNLK